jgi:hypothetical protein
MFFIYGVVALLSEKTRLVHLLLSLVYRVFVAFNHSSVFTTCVNRINYADIV